MDYTGTLKVKGDIQEISEKFSKRDFVVSDETNQYPQHVSFQIANDKMDLLDKFNVGDEIKVHFNLQGREWTNKERKVVYFNTLSAWKLEGQGSGTGPSTKPAESTKTETKSFNELMEDASDLPF